MEFLTRRNKKILLFSITILLFAFGYNIAPDPLPDGSYTISIEYDNEPTIFLLFKVEINSSLKDSVVMRQINSTVTYSTLSITYFEQYSGKIENSIEIYAIIYENNIALTNPNTQKFTASLIGQKQHITFSPSGTDDEIVEFKFRVLKQTNIALGLLLAISFLWLTELVPMAATSLLIPIIIVLFDIDTATGALSEFSNPTVYLFLGGFLMAIGMNKTKLDEYIALQIIAHTPPNSKMLLASFMGLAAIFSMFMSNTAATAILIAIALQLLNNIGIKDVKYKKTIVLGIAYAATIGGIGTLIGTPPNVIAVGMIESYTGISISFVDWFAFGLPVVMIMLPLAYFNILWRFKPDIDEKLLIQAKNLCITELENRGKFSRDQSIISVIFISVLLLWMTASIHHISTGIVALIGAVALYFTGIVKQEDMNRLNWNALITFGGGLTLGSVILRTGLADWFAMKFSLLKDIPVFMVLLLMGIVAIVLTQIASNTASAAILIPITMPLAEIMGINPIAAAIMIAILCSMDFAIYIGSPPTLLAYSTGLFKVKEIFNTGLILDIIGLFFVVILSWTLFGFLIIFI